VKHGVNGALVRKQRIAAGWSVPELARRLGVQASVCWAIERGCLPALQQLPLAAFADLADLLDIPLAEFFPAAEPRQPQEPRPDATVVEAVLLRYPDGLTREALACGLGWSLDRVERALEDLADCSPTAGGRLRRVAGNRYRIEARRSALSAEQWRAMVQAAASMNGADAQLSTEAAVLLHRLLYHGRPVSSEHCGQDDPGVLELLRRELIEDVGGRFAAVAEVAYSQGLSGADHLACH
jgi:transcriptional regulator with XRE-family HTH domain